MPATREWVGNAPAVAQIDTFTPANVEALDTFTITINNKAITFTAADTLVASVCTGIVALLNASTIPEFAEITWGDATTHVTGTGDTAGVEFTATSSAIDGGGTGTQTFVQATITANEGPNDWSTPENWTGATVPITGDTVILDSGDVDILYGLDQSAVVLAAMHRNEAYTGLVGLPETNATNALSYPEYRSTYLKVGVTAGTYGEGAGPGSGRFKLDNGTNLTIMSIRTTGSAVEEGIPALLWKGTHVSNEMNVSKGSVGVALFANEVATILKLRSSFRDSEQSQDVEITCGSGVTLNAGTAEIIIASGLIRLESATNLITQRGGVLDLEGTAAHVALNVDGGYCNYNTNGTLTAGKVGSDGTIDCSKDIRTKTFTDLELNEGAAFHDPNKVVTYTNPIELPRTGLEKLAAFRFGDHYTIQRGAI